MTLLGQHRPPRALETFACFMFCEYKVKHRIMKDNYSIIEDNYSPSIIGDNYSESHILTGNVQSVFKREICSPNVPFLDFTSFMKDNIQKKNPRCEFFPSPQGNRILFAWGPKPL
jgi:hypothetical protein